MEPFKRDLKWSTYQDKQLEVLISLDKSFSSSLKVSHDISTNLNKVEYALEAIARDTVKNVDSFNAGLSKIASTSIVLDKKLKSTSIEVDKFSNKLQTAGDTFASRLVGVVDNIWNHLGGLRGIGDQANSYSKMNNDMIRLTGMNGQMIKEFRSEFMTMINTLNTETGSAYNAQESYRQLVTIASSTTGNLEALQEMSRPLLLAQETLNSDIGSLSTIFNRFYTRYNFTSIAMEEMVDDIRSSSANNQATSDEIVKNLLDTQTLIESISKGDTSLISQYSKTISDLTSYYESMGFSSSFIPQLLKDIDSGEITSNLLAMQGLSAANMNIGTARDMLRNSPESIPTLVEAVVKGESEFYKQITKDNGANAGGIISKRFGVEYDELRAIDNYVFSRDQTFDEFVKSLDETTKATELVEDKYVSAADKTNNWLENIYEKLATIQEKFGIGFSDIAIISYLARDLFRGGLGRGSGGVSGGVRSFLGSYSTSGAAGLGTGAGTTGLLGAAEMGGFNLSGGALTGGSAAALGAAGAAGVAGGAALGLYGYHSGVKDIANGNGGTGLANLAGGTLATGGAAALGAGLLGVGATNIWNPVGWALLAAGAVTLAGTAIYKASTAIGSVEAIEKAYDDAAKKIKVGTMKNEQVLTEIYAGLQDESKTEEMRKKLLNSGILSDKDYADAKTAQIDKLRELTDAYMQATKKFANSYDKYSTDYKLNDEQYGKELHTNISKFLGNELNFIGKDAEMNKELATQFSKSMYVGLKEQLDSGVVFDKKTQSYYDSLEKNLLNLKPGENLSAWDLGWLYNNNFFGMQNYKNSSAINTVVNQRALSYVRDSGISGSDSFYEKMLPKDLTFYGDEGINVSKILAELESTPDKFRAQQLLNDLKSSNIDISKYPEIQAIAKEKGLSYAIGTNYVARDQVAVLHEGEAVVPKRYNPAVNSAEIQKVSEQMRNEQSASTKELIDSIKEIKEFLGLWKDDNIRREQVSSARLKYSASNEFIRKYLLGN